MGIFVVAAMFLLSFITIKSSFDTNSQIISPIPKEKKEVAAVITKTPTPSPKPTEYTVSSGDTLQKIAEKFYGDSKYWTILWNDNNWIEDFRVIQPGWELSLRTSAPNDEELNEDLLAKYEEITNPSPTPAPFVNRAIGSTGSFGDVYKSAGSQYGIPWEILYGLHLIETGLRDGPISNGSGPQGPLQFLPGTWALYGIDGNGDGVADINNAVDAIYGAANYLARHGGVEPGLQSYGNVIDKVYSAARNVGWGG